MGHRTHASSAHKMHIQGKIKAGLRREENSGQCEEVNELVTCCDFLPEGALAFT